ncbi:hypothetical protein Pcinc_007691 [Petrolisthes cinctipes]|uniref:Uncharacterized protein n=1 Tax=Petrolisthes cinctipes TaxID=88211 RepID=A0AAE1KX66_PETCI|nr:hypothetical protein Pcinc_007691 [Petrolisthes cinctipes]
MGVLNLTKRDGGNSCRQAPLPPQPPKPPLSVWSILSNPSRLPAIPLSVIAYMRMDDPHEDEASGYTSIKNLGTGRRGWGIGGDVSEMRKETNDFTFSHTLS